MNNQISYLKSEDLQNGMRQAPKKYEQVSSIGGTIYKTRKDGSYEFMPVKIGDFQLPNPQIRIVGRKTIIDTPMVEVSGSVLEHISIDSYIINIKGIIKSTDGLWPDEEFAQLCELWQRNETLPIDSPKTNRLLNGNEYVVLTNIEYPEDKGFVESLEYNLECISDIPFTLEID